jgi:hypothetical protein
VNFQLFDGNHDIGILSGDLQRCEFNDGNISLNIKKIYPSARKIKHEDGQYGNDDHGIQAKSLNQKNFMVFVIIIMVTAIDYFIL